MSGSLVKDVMEFMGVEQHVALALLSKYRWDKQELLSAYFENPERVLSEAGISLKSDNSNANTDTEIECTICFDLTNEFTVLSSCGHVFCNQCWQENLSIQIKDGKTIDIHCMNQGCKELVPEHIVQKVVDADSWKKYAKFLSKNFVERSQEVRWCPAPGCNKAVYDPIIEADNYIGICSCGQKFCWKCGKSYHTPASCKDFEDWEVKKGSDDILTLKWVQENTKQCPNDSCKNPIEKNDGCFMMTCSQCHYQFCWLCRQDWSTHGDHFSCSKFNDGVLQNKPEFREGDQDKYITEEFDNKFLFYYERYKHYEQSLKYEDTVKEKFVSLTSKIENICGMVPTFLYTSLEQLHTCRILLMNMFVILACQKKDDADIHSIDTQAGTLEVITEKLAFVLEKQLNDDFILEQNWVLTIKNLTKIARQFVQNILEGGLFANNA